MPAAARRVLGRARRVLTGARLLLRRPGGPSRGRAAVAYDGAYFGEGRDPSGDRQGRSGYATYDRISSNADIAAYLLWRNFRVTRALDVGCATGFLVEALRELGIDAAGCDASQYAIDHATPGAAGFVEVGDLVRGLPHADGSFDLVTALEVLEHLEPDQVPAALRELRRVCGGVCYATIPSFGPNESGPDGHFEGKVRPDRLAHYRALGSSYDGPVPVPDLAVDAEGSPVEGHLTIASFSWWTARFAEAGFERWTDVERRLYRDIEPAGLARYWNLYVFATPGTPRSVAEALRPGASLTELGLVHPLFEARR